MSGESTTDVSILTGGLMNNIGAFIKKNAVMLGLGAVAAGGAIYLLVRKKKNSRSLSGIPRPRRTVKRKRKSAPPKRLKALGLS